MQMLTISTERFQKIQKEAPAEFQKYLLQVTKYQAAKNCKVWYMQLFTKVSEIVGDFGNTIIQLVSNIDIL